MAFRSIDNGRTAVRRHESDRKLRAQHATRGKTGRRVPLRPVSDPAAGAASAARRDRKRSIEVYSRRLMIDFA